MPVHLPFTIIKEIGIKLKSIYLSWKNDAPICCAILHLTTFQFNFHFTRTKDILITKGKLWSYSLLKYSSLQWIWGKGNDM